MEGIIKRVGSWIEKHTTGASFVLWSVSGIAGSTFLIVFRDHEAFDFEKLVYLIPLSGLWVFFSDIAQKRQLIHRQLHFVFNSIAYLLLFGMIIYYTGGYSGGLFFIFFLAPLVAPVMSTVTELIIFLVVLSLFTHGVYYIGQIHADAPIDPYHVGVLILQSIFYFVIAGIHKYFQHRLTQTEIEKREVIKQMVKTCQHDVEEKTVALQQLVEKMKVSEEHLRSTNVEMQRMQEALKAKVDELERFNRLAVGREVKMVELKKKMALYEQTK